MDAPAACRRQRANVVAMALDQMARDPNACFSMEACRYLREVGEDLPDRRNEMLSLSREGRLDWGATWNQPFESLLSGEQLVRQVLLGRGWAAREFGLDLPTAMNADVPSRAWQWPQVLSRAGVRYLYSGRHVPGLYRWVAPDGSAVLAWSGGHYNWHWSVYLKKDLHESLDTLRKYLPEWTAAASLVDGRPWLPIPAMCDASMPKDLGPLRAALGAEGLADAREATFTRAFSTGLAGQASVEVSGEKPNPWLYIHGPGHVRAVSDQRAAARLLPQSEALAVLLTVRAIATDGESTARAEAWRDSMAADHGWGGKHGEITDADFAAAHARARSWAEAAIERDLARLLAAVAPSTATERAALVWNGLSWPRGGTVVIPLAARESRHVVAADGRILPGEIMDTGHERCLLVRVPDVPALGWTVLRLADGPPPPPPPPRKDEDVCEPGHDGGIVLNPPGLQARRGFGRVFHLQSNGVDVGEETDGRGEPGDPSEQGRECTDGGTWALEYDGALARRWVSRHPLKHAVVTRRLTVWRGESRAEMEIELRNWTGEHGREWRLDLGVDADGADVDYAVPFGHARLGTVECARLAGEKIQSLREVQDSVTVGIGADRALTVALVGMPVCDLRRDARGVQIEPILLASRKSCHPQGPWYAQPGDHRFHVAWKTHGGGGGIGWRHGLEMTHPLRVAVGASGKTTPGLPASGGLLRVEGPGASAVQVTAVKPSEDGRAWIVRLCEMTGRPVEVTVRLGFAFQSAHRSDPLEKAGPPLPLLPDGGIPVRVGAHEILSLCVTPLPTGAED